jgi:hypothetical protein
MDWKRSSLGRTKEKRMEDPEDVARSEPLLRSFSKTSLQKKVPHFPEGVKGRVQENENDLERIP